MLSGAPFARTGGGAARISRARAQPLLVVLSFLESVIQFALNVVARGTATVVDQR
jgi:hypothetical protein